MIRIVPLSLYYAGLNSRRKVLVSREHSSGNRTMLLGICKRGNRYLRTLLIHVHDAPAEDDWRPAALPLIHPPKGSEARVVP